MERKGGWPRWGVGKRKGAAGTDSPSNLPPSEPAFCFANNGVHFVGREAARGAFSSKSLYSYLL